MTWTHVLVLTLLTIQSGLLALFVFFAWFNYLYGVASLLYPRIPRVRPEEKRIAVVIVAFNEGEVIEQTIRACEALTYKNKIIIVADDSNDQIVVEQLRHAARARGARQVPNTSFYQGYLDGNGTPRRDLIEIWESPGFVLFHRPSNVGFKSGSLEKVLSYLEGKHIDRMYLLDADWHPQPDALERTLEVLEAQDNTAFVQAKRLAFPNGMNLFQKYVAVVEEGCYHVDFQGRQVLGHPILFSGCCTLFRLEAVHAVGGFQPGHLTEDLDLTNRLWVQGWKGVYLGDVVNYGEVPFTYDHYRRQQERWAAGSARALREHWRSLLTTRDLSFTGKLSAFRQNAYFTTTLLTGLAIFLSLATVSWLITCWNTYAVETYLYFLEYVKPLMVTAFYFCVLSNFVEPMIMILAKRRRWQDLCHLPMTIWYGWSVLWTYWIGNLKGLLGARLDWFRTPKFQRDRVGPLGVSPLGIRAANAVMCLALVGLYCSQGWFFGWFDEFALLLLPAFFLGSIR